MAKYILTSPAFLSDGAYYEASMEKPMVVRLPDDEPPSLKWTPCDDAAVAALNALREQKVDNMIADMVSNGVSEKMATIRANRDTPKVKEIPGEKGEAARLKAIAVTPEPRPSDEQKARNLLDRVQTQQNPEKKAEENPAATLLAKAGGGGKRAADQEPA